MDNQLKAKNEALTELLQLLGADTEEYAYKILLPDRGCCGIRRMAFTTGLFYGITEFVYEGRYCFHTFKEAAAALAVWSGTGDPPGNWIKHKGHTEYSNPNYTKDE